METWLPILLSGAMLAVSWMTLARNGRKDSAADVAERARLVSDVRYIRSSVDDIKAESRMTREDVKALESRVSRVEAASASAHKRMDDYVGKGVCS